MVRVVLFPKGPRDPAATDRQITIDMVVDAGGSAIGPFPAFGRMGDFTKPEMLYPFALMGDGRIDYGAYASDGARQDKLAIRTARLAPGAEILRTAAGTTEIFLIDTVTPLAAT
ncbi:hypothetical protein [Sphingomonas gei]|nr:hypothetical protein [Sphingomonas gei]